MAVIHLGQRRARIGRDRYVTAYGLLLYVPRDRKIDPALDAVWAATGNRLLKVRDGETCAAALARASSECEERENLR